ncbi:type I restriction modification DNA specificity domain protein [Paraburkholderia xenovorans LB400]|uniref:HsdS protein n=1 Tax=Paraburkholderia xenovorans (strain LB400) TaxID=266265 RepID=Q13T80_PARXL|nr:restriction endonuclease subunit S [Paraburkholderia xenovorans]ABE32709.1 Putative HsdS protein [Paraburkholderia xenovorans LB400]AIP31632.1 type I restriction modification DNA specificity domain protein [Paraburkholderia xenovorans LB400]
MSSEWTHVRLGELAEVKHGWAFKSDYFKADDEAAGLPIVVAIGNFQYTGGFRFESTQIKRYTGEFPSEYILQPGEILLVMTCQTAGGEILGIPARVPDNGRVYLHNQRLGKVVLKSGRVCSDFLYWLFLYPPFNRHLVNSATGTKILHTAPSRIESFEFKLPSVAEQREIAEALDAIDDRISLLRETNVTLEAIAQAMFKSWFVDFEPVRAKQEGRAPEGMDEATAALFPDGFEESELGLVPRAWRARSLDSFADYLNGLALQKFPAESEDEYLPVIKIAQLRAGNTQNADRASTKLKAEYIVRDGDVLFSWSGSLEVELWCGGEGALNQHLFKVTSSEVPKWFYYLATRHHLPEFREIAAHKATTMGHIQRKHLTEAKIAVPPPEVLTRLTEFVAPLIELRIENAVRIRSLGELRDSLLPRLISGQLHLSEAETLVA